MLIFSQHSIVGLQIDGSKEYQTLDGFGVNINPAWWYNGGYGDTKVLQPAIDLLVDSLGATIFRAVIEEIDWEAVNDDSDPDNFNWTYYNSIFTNDRFSGVWNTLRYLNQKGITDGLIISFMGAPPAPAPLTAPDPRKSWMGGTNYTISTNMEDEFVESIAALLWYMRHTAKVQFHLVSPMNETDVIAGSKSTNHPGGIVEGPNMPDAVQYTRVIRKLAEKLDVIGMSDIRFVAPDAAGDGFDCVYQHGRRNGYGSTPPNDWVFWLPDAEGKPLIEYIPSAKSWVPRKQFYEHAQLMKFIKPGAVRIGTTCNDSNLVVHSYRNPTGQLVIAGRSGYNCNR